MHQNPIPQLANSQIRLYLSRFLVKNKKLTQLRLDREVFVYWQDLGRFTVCRRAADSGWDQAGQSIAKVLAQQPALWRPPYCTPVTVTSIPLGLHPRCGQQDTGPSPGPAAPTGFISEPLSSELVPEEITHTVHWPEVGQRESACLGLQHREAEPTSHPPPKKKEGDQAQKDKCLPQKGPEEMICRVPSSIKI